MITPVDSKRIIIDGRVCIFEIHAGECGETFEVLMQDDALVIFHESPEFGCRKIARLPYHCRHNSREELITHLKAVLENHPETSASLPKDSREQETQQ